jgi:hypothetical protein
MCDLQAKKSFGCPIQAVLWLEWARMPPLPSCHPQPSTCLREVKGEMNAEIDIDSIGLFFAHQERSRGNCSAPFFQTKASAREFAYLVRRLDGWDLTNL